MSWSNVKIANGYERVVLNWQGMYWEVSKEQIEWGSVVEKMRTEEGVRKWTTEGVSVFKFEKEYEHILQRHRFAMMPPNGEKICRGDLRYDKYYIRIYQTKINRGKNDIRWLR